MSEIAAGGTRSAEAAPDVGDFEPFARCWVADDGTPESVHALAWAGRVFGGRGLEVDAFRVGDPDDPPAMATLPLPHPADLVVVGVSDADSRRRARALVNLFGCSIAIVPESTGHGAGIVCGVDRLTDAAVTSAAAGAEAEHAGTDVLLVHAVPARLQPFSTRPSHTDPALRVARAALERHHPTVRSSSRLRSTAPVNALLDEARGRAMIVVGGERISSPGSVLGDLIDRTPIPLLVARGAGSSRLAR